MALVASPVWKLSTPPFNLIIPGVAGSISLSTQATLDTANDEFVQVGQVSLSTGPNTSATFNTSSKIGFMVGASTVWANAGTNVRVGIQDIDTTTGPPGRGDGTFDVYADLVPGTETLTSSTWYNATMETGSKSIAHGDFIAVHWKMTALGGADSLKIGGLSSGQTVNRMGAGFSEAGGAFSAVTAATSLVLDFNGTVFGQLDPVCTPYNAGGTIAIDDSPEVGFAFTPEADMMVDMLIIQGNVAASTVNLTLQWYTAPTTSVATLGASLASDGNTIAGAGVTRGTVFVFPAGITLAAGTEYGFGIVSGAAGSNFTALTADVSDANHWKATFGGFNSGASYISRTSGNFTATTTRRLAVMMRCWQIDDGAGGAGGGSTRVFGG